MKPLSRRRSLSTRLALAFAVSLIVLTVLTTGAAVLGYYLVLHAHVDEQLAEDVAAWRGRVVGAPDGPAWASARVQSEADEAPASGGPFLRLLGPRGDVRWASSAFAGWPPFPHPTAVPPPPQRSHAWGGTYARSRYVPVGEGWIEVTRLETSPHHGIGTIAALLLAGFALSALAAALLGHALARRTLRPIREVRTAAEEVGASALDRRIPIDGGARDEVVELAETFNRMLDRLEASFERERRFTADAAHELLTPLARMRAEAELALRAQRRTEPPPESDPRPSFEALLREVDGLTALADGLLRAARGAARRAGRPEPVDLSAVCRGQLDRAEALAETRGLRLSGEVMPGVVVEGDRVSLEEAVENVLANALKYTPPEGGVHLHLRREEGRARLTVADTGLGFAADEAERAFERFYRSARPDVQARPGSGLGLAFVREVAEAAGGRARIESEGVGRGSRVVLTLPLYDGERIPDRG